ncbi:MAG: HPF/RaiA family ribosome-associated protein [Bdellovibrionota bacterium]
MTATFQLTMHGIEPSEAIEGRIRDKVADLERFYDRITSCRVTVELQQKHKHQGKLYNVRIDLRVPGKEIAVNRESNEDLYVSLRDAFHAARRQLEDHVRRFRGDVKHHEERGFVQGRVIELVVEKDFGRIESEDGREIYFHRHSVPEDGFEKLEVGSPVFFVEEQGKRGPQASAVRVAAKLPTPKAAEARGI